MRTGLRASYQFVGHFRSVVVVVSSNFEVEHVCYIAVGWLLIFIRHRTGQIDERLQKKLIWNEDDSLCRKTWQSWGSVDWCVAPSLIGYCGRSFRSISICPEIRVCDKVINTMVSLVGVKPLASNRPARASRLRNILHPKKKCLWSQDLMSRFLLRFRIVNSTHIALTELLPCASA